MYQAISKVVKNNLTLKTEFWCSKEIKKLTQEKESLETQFSNQFSTPIRPSNQKLNVSPLKHLKHFKIPFYVPRTNEIGEMITIPRVTDEGFLVYRLDFLDPHQLMRKLETV